VSHVFGAGSSACLILTLVCSSTVLADDAEGDSLPRLSPRLSWIRTEGFRCGYNYCAPLNWYPRAKACGMNGIISRLEIANDPGGDEAISARYAETDRMPDAVRCWRLLRPSSQAARDNGLRFFYMLNLGGSRGNIDDGLRDNPRRFNNGKLFSPLDGIYWTRVVENRFLRVADMLAGDEYQIDGFLIDPEMYAEGGATPGDIDYGDYALSEFVEATGAVLDFEALSIGDRQALVAERGLRDKLYDFEFGRIRALAQRTREKLQAKVPDAIVGFFLWRPLLWYKAVAAGFSTPEVPCFVGPESTYPGAFDDEFLAYRDGVRRQAGVPILFVPGLRFGFENDAVPREFLKVLPGNLYHRSINTEGYWFWAMSRLGRTDEERAPFIDVLQTVNRELDWYFASSGTHKSPLRPAPLPLERPAHLQELLIDARAWQPVPQQALPDNDPGPAGMTLRGLHTFVIRASEGDALTLRIANVPLGPYTAPTACTFFRPDGSAVPQPDVPLRQSATVTQQADAKGAWVVAITSHNNAFWVLPEVACCVLVSPDRFGLCKPRGAEGLNRFFLYVPRGTESFRIEMIASEGEPALFRVFDSAGESRFQRKITERVVQEFEPGDQAGKVWWLETSEVAEDHAFRLIGIPSIVAAKAEQLLVPHL
jgi:hypothetical protein